MPTRDDYILRFLDLIRQAIAASIKHRKNGQPEQALLGLIIAQEKLFARPAPDFLPLSLDEQIALLRRGEAPESARAKVLGYAQVLTEAAHIYRESAKPDLAAGADQLALHIYLTLALETDSDVHEAEIAELLARIPAETLQPTVLEMLERYQGRLREG